MFGYKKRKRKKRKGVSMGKCTNVDDVLEWYYSKYLPWWKEKGQQTKDSGNSNPPPPPCHPNC